MSKHFVGTIPFSSGPSQRDTGVRNRTKIYKRFIGGALSGNVLNIGDDDLIIPELAEKYECSTGDLNYEIGAQHGKYDVITCFEIIEHVMNPLHLVEKMRDLLNDDGAIYLSTPRVFLSIFQSPWHFTEYKEPKLRILFGYAGLQVARYEVFRQYPTWWAFTGFRPFLRVLFHSNMLFELRKKRS